MTCSNTTESHINAAACKLERMVAQYDGDPRHWETIVEYGTRVEERAVQARLWPLASRLGVMMVDFMCDTDCYIYASGDPNPLRVGVSERRYQVCRRGLAFWPVLVGGVALEKLGVVSRGTAVRWAAKQVKAS